MVFWNLSINGFLPLLGMVVGVIRFLAYDSAYSHTDGTDIAKAALGSAVMKAVKIDSVSDTLLEVMLLMAWQKNFESIRYGVWNARPDETREAEIEKWTINIAKAAEEIAEARAAAGLTMGDAKAEEAVEEGEEATEGEEEASVEGENDDEEEDTAKEE